MTNHSGDMHEQCIFIWNGSIKKYGTVATYTVLLYHSIFGNCIYIYIFILLWDMLNSHMWTLRICAASVWMHVHKNTCYFNIKGHASGWGYKEKTVADGTVALRRSWSWGRVWRYDPARRGEGAQPAVKTQTDREQQSRLRLQVFSSQEGMELFFWSV